MSDGKPFWSSVPGVVTGVAGVISAIVGLVGVSTQLGWIGGDDKASTASSANGAPTTTASTVPGSPTTSAVAARSGEFEVEPASVSFEPLQPREATVTVRNTGDVALTMRAPTVSRSGAEHFKATDMGCLGSTLSPGRSCEIKVTFAPLRAGQHSAALVVAASNAPRQVEVDLKGNALLG